MNQLLLSRDEVIDALRPVAENGIPGPNTARLLDIGNEKYLEFINKEILDEFIIQGGATCRFYEAPFGSGKTHVLQLISDTILDKNMAVVNIELSEGLSLEDWRLITQYILQNLIIKINGNIIKSLPDILVELSKQEGFKKDKLEKALLPHPGFQNAMLYAIENHKLKPSAWQLLKKYLLGEKVTIGDLRKAGIKRVTNPLSKRNGEQILKTVINGLYHAGLNGTAIFFDENEKQLDTNRLIPPKKTIIAANIMRRLIDNCSVGGYTGVIVLFAVLPDFWGNCSKVYPALAQRLIVRGKDVKKAWRSPVVELEAISTVIIQKDFSNKAIDKIEFIVKQNNGSLDNLREELQKEADRVYFNVSGKGYKRSLMKAFATVALKHLED